MAFFGLHAKSILSCALAALIAVVAQADDWRDFMWKRPVSQCPGVTLRAYALEQPRLMKAYVAKIDMTAPGIGFTATECSPGSGRDVQLAVNSSSDVVEGSCGKDPSRGFFFIIRKDGTPDIVAHPAASISNEVSFAMYGNGLVLKNGKNAYPEDGEMFMNPEPRTAFGLTADRKTLVIVAVDGRQPGYSLGASYADLAEIFRREGCTDAISLDDGGSTSLAVFDRKNGRPATLNRLPGGSDRKMALNFGVVCDETDGACAKKSELERTGAIFHSYEFNPIDDVPPPDGYTPFYISHYGRHGSRRLLHDCPAETLAILDGAAQRGQLTALGQELHEAVRRLVDVSDGMSGQLSERGAEEHRTLARRMAARFPAVFSGRRRVRCQSTDVHRVLLSQTNFAISLKDAAPQLEFDFSAGCENILKHGSRHRKGEKSRLRHEKERTDNEFIKPDALLARLFTTPDAVKHPVLFARLLFACASNCQCMRTELGGVDMYRFFTDDEIAGISRAMSAWYYISHLNSAEFGEGLAWAAQWLARDFVERADFALSDDRIAADLRFGHDIGLGPLVALLDVAGPGDRVAPEDAWRLYLTGNVMPMAANIQFVFYRNASGDVLVKILYNERETVLRGISPSHGIYYRWEDLRTHILRLVKELG